MGIMPCQRGTRVPYVEQHAQPLAFWDLASKIPRSGPESKFELGHVSLPAHRSNRTKTQIRIELRAFPRGCFWDQIMRMNLFYYP
jgi:hypothetical protein